MSLLRLLGQLTLIALVVGTSVTAAATERVTIRLVLTGAALWSFVPVIQLGTGLWLVRRADPRERLQALERYFETHWFWSLWILVIHGLFVAWPLSRSMALLLLPTAALPAMLTSRALVRICRELHMPAREAWRTVAVHQAMTYGIVLAYAAWGSAYVPRLVGLFR